ncbi:toprim domain-containing protein, partial [Thermus sp.]|uniref:toprim domain-containing protein n=1 Tax=Thermus sp. TaxID=275 RepID=UPI0025DD5EA9
YLHARGLCIPPPPSLRLALWGDTPVMLARITGPRGDLVGLHLTTLEPGGRARKEKRLAAGSKPLGGAIRLFPLEEGQPLALAEGIETALAVHQATGWPAWATVSASFMPYVHIPPEVREVVICPDNDPPGLEAGRRLARRLPGEGRKVRLAVPPIPGADWLDLLKQAKTPGLPAGGGEQGGR